MKVKGFFMEKLVLVQSEGGSYGDFDNLDNL